MLKFFQRLLALAPVLMLVATACASDLDNSLADLSGQIASEMQSKQRQVIAVIEFSDLDGRVTELGKYISEELITRLFRTGKFQVIERQLMIKVIKEHELNLSGLVDESSAKELGRILGVDAICSGTITDLVSQVKVNARLISTETGSLFAVATVSIAKDEVISSLMEKSYSTPAMNTGTAGQKPVTGRSGDVFYFEDFSQVKEGLLPEGWIGGATLSVSPSTKKRGCNVLQNFQRGKHSFTVPNLTFPENWKFELEAVNHDDPWVNAFVFKIGEIEVKFRRDYGVGERTGGAMFLNGIMTATPAPPKGQTFLITVEKDGDVVGLFLDNVKVKVIRMAKIDPPRGVSFSYTKNFGIYRMVGTALP